MAGWTKTKTYASHHFDSEAWDVVKSRDDDIVIATAYKSGTTWMQQIMSELLFNASPRLHPDVGTDSLFLHNGVYAGNSTVMI